MTRRAYVAFCLFVAILLLAAWLSQPASEPRRLVPTPITAPTCAPTALGMEPV